MWKGEKSNFKASKFNKKRLGRQQDFGAAALFYISDVGNSEE